MPDGGGHQNKCHEENQHTFVAFNGDINQDIERLQRRMLWFSEVKNQGEVGHHEHGQDVHDHDACGQGDAHGLNRRHRGEHQRDETDDGRHGRKEHRLSGRCERCSHFLVLRALLFGVSVRDVKPVRHAQGQQNGSDDDHRHRHLIIGPTDETEGPEHSAQRRQTGDHHHLESLKWSYARDACLKQVGVENKQPDGHQNNSVGEDVPEQFEGKFGHSVGDWNRACEHHGQAKIFPGAHAFGGVWVTVVLEFARTFHLGNDIEDLLCFGDDVLGRAVLGHSDGHDGTVEHTVRSAVLSTFDVASEFVETCRRFVFVGVHLADDQIDGGLTWDFVRTTELFVGQSDRIVDLLGKLSGWAIGCRVV